MPTFTVKAASKKKDVPDARFGPAQVIALKLSNGDGEKDAEWFTKATTTIPAIGSQLEGELEQSEYGWKFKKASAGGGFGGRSPRDSRRIERQHSQEMALRALVFSDNNYHQLDWSELREVIKEWTDWFMADLDNAGADVGGGGSSASAPADPGPVPAADVNTNPPSTKQMEFLARLLGDAKMGPNTIQVVTAYAQDNLTGGQNGSMSKTIDGLKGEDESFLSRLVVTAQEWSEKQSDVPADRTPSPEEQAIPDDEGIPF